MKKLTREKLFRSGYSADYINDVLAGQALSNSTTPYSIRGVEAIQRHQERIDRYERALNDPRVEGE